MTVCTRSTGFTFLVRWLFHPQYYSKLFYIFGAKNVENIMNFVEKKIKITTGIRLFSRRHQIEDSKRNQNRLVVILQHYNKISIYIFDHKSRFFFSPSKKKNTCTHFLLPHSTPLARFYDISLYFLLKKKHFFTAVNLDV